LQILGISSKQVHEFIGNEDGKQAENVIHFPSSVNSPEVINGMMLKLDEPGRLYLGAWLMQ
jgi:hypothetical protein